MHVEIPVITRCGPSLKMQENGAYIKNKEGIVSWAYKGCELTGKGIYVAACARSGTVYTTRILQKLGYEVSHEMTGADGSVGYHLAIIKPDNCFHQVRHPLKQISSMHDYQSWGFINQVVECHGRGILGCMQYWLKWNELLESFCIWRYQIEELSDIWPEFLERIDHPYEDLPEVPKEEKNTREKSLSCMCKGLTELNWEQLFSCNRELAQKIYDKHLEYGYSPAVVACTQTRISCNAKHSYRDKEDTKRISG